MWQTNPTSRVNRSFVDENAAVDRALPRLRLMTVAYSFHCEPLAHSSPLTCTEDRDCQPYRLLGLTYQRRRKDTKYTSKPFGCYFWKLELIV
jgi:hypothetical protein